MQAIQGHHGHVLGKDVDLVIDFLQLIGGFKEGIEFLLRDVSVGSKMVLKHFLAKFSFMIPLIIVSFSS